MDVWRYMHPYHREYTWSNVKGSLQSRIDLWLLSSVVISEEEGRRHRIAFNSLYLFSFRSIVYEANGEELYNFTRGATLNWISIPYAVS